MADADAKKVFNEFNPNLVRSLPLKDPFFVAELTSQHLFSGSLKEEVMGASTQADAATKFLYGAIERSLNVDNKEPFDRLLLVMETFNDLTLNKLAKDIKQELGVIDDPEPAVKDSEPSDADTSVKYTENEVIETQSQTSHSEPADEDLPENKVAGSQNKTSHYTCPIKAKELLGFQSVVIDNGSHAIKAGLATENNPKVILDSVLGRLLSNDKEAHIEHKKLYIGSEAKEKHSFLNLTYPINRGIITNWDAMEEIWHHIFHNELSVPSEEYPLMLTDIDPSNKVSREKMIEIMFEKFNIPKMFLCIQPVLSLYATGSLTGMVLESGDGVTQIVPIHDGFSLPHATIRLNVGGRDLTDYLIKTLITERGYSFTTIAEHDIARDIKEKMCYTALEYEQETQAANDGSKDQNYELPDGKMITIGSERFRCPETLFKPCASYLRMESGIHQICYDSIMKCDIDIREKLFGKIMLSGGNTMFPGLADRMQKEMMSIAPSTTKSPVMKTRVYALPERKHLAWIGGSVLASVSTFQQMWATKDDYDEHGPSIVHRRIPF